MNGVHDLGGMHGHGPVDPPASEPIFRGEWERKAFGLFFGCFAAGQFDVDRFRHEIEKMGAAHYLESPYYAHWMHAIENILVQNGTLTEKEIAERVAQLSGSQTAKEAA